MAPRKSMKREKVGYIGGGGLLPGVESEVYPQRRVTVSRQQLRYVFKKKREKRFASCLARPSHVVVAVCERNDKRRMRACVRVISTKELHDTRHDTTSKKPTREKTTELYSSGGGVTATRA